MRPHPARYHLKTSLLRLSHFDTNYATIPKGDRCLSRRSRSPRSKWNFVKQHVVVRTNLASEVSPLFRRTGASFDWFSQQSPNLSRGIASSKLTRLSEWKRSSLLDLPCSVPISARRRQNTDNDKTKELAGNRNTSLLLVRLSHASLHQNGPAREITLTAMHLRRDRHSNNCL